MIARPKKHQQILARPVYLQNWSPVLLYGRGVVKKVPNAHQLNYLQTKI